LLIIHLPVYNNERIFLYIYTLKKTKNKITPTKIPLQPSKEISFSKPNKSNLKKKSESDQETQDYININRKKPSKIIKNEKY